MAFLLQTTPEQSPGEKGKRGGPVFINLNSDDEGGFPGTRLYRGLKSWWNHTLINFRRLQISGGHRVILPQKKKNLEFSCGATWGKTTPFWSESTKGRWNESPEMETKEIFWGHTSIAYGTFFSKTLRDFLFIFFSLPRSPIFLNLLDLKHFLHQPENFGYPSSKINVCFILTWVELSIWTIHEIYTIYIIPIYNINLNF